MAELLLQVPFIDSVKATCARGKPEGTINPEGTEPALKDDGTRRGMHFGKNTCVHYRGGKNFNRREGTVMLWFKPDWAADCHFPDNLGRILWDLRIEHGSIVTDDPSQRWALVYTNPGGKRDPRTLQCWRFCVATNRNRYVIRTTELRKDKRTRQAVFSSQQKFKAGQWMHLAVTWTSDAAAIWINGSEDVRAPLPEGLPTRSLPKTMQVGAISSWINAGPCGVISDFQVYGAALDRKRILSIIVRGGKHVCSKI